ncbi:head decoration protein [Pseudomonas otitidis]|uniref:head decoration protein n=1 Tax=Pseudomonadaceae TaxID=135621 RepID=UPI002446901C|nr:MULTISPECIES: head decoration protein [Pseudomonas]MDG9783104.1 head decoration protein [Pseudomonas otitidis]MDI6524768.1 head decoration protein [Pseudomonas otitidis]MDU9398378.1 head decoration protein [Pseudomonas sp. zfem003]
MTTVNQPTDNWVTGSAPYHTTLGTIASGQNLPAKTPLGQVTATGLLVKWNPAATDGSQNAVYLTAYAVDATAAAKSAQVISGGQFNPEQVAWPVGATAAQKATAFVGTPIGLQLPV